jgi:hypothetical protein
LLNGRIAAQSGRTRCSAVNGEFATSRPMHCSNLLDDVVACANMGRNIEIERLGLYRDSTRDGSTPKPRMAMRSS